MNNLQEKTEITKELFKINETLERLEIKNRVTLHRWEKSGYLTPIRIGKSVRYRLSDINALLNGDVPVSKTDVNKGGENV